MILDPFVLRATLAGLGAVLAAAPLGVFVVWRRMAFFGDATAHAALLGVALSLALAVSITWGVLAVALAMAMGISTLVRRGTGADSALAVLSHGALAAGLVAASILPGMRADLSSYLFGDILAVGGDDVAMIWGGGALVAALVGWRWSSLLTATLDPDLARAAGIDPDRESIFLSIALALTVAIAIKVVGALLIAALLIVPAAAARPLSRSPEAMAMLTGAIGVASVVIGVAASMTYDSPTGPSIVCAAALIFAASHAFERKR